MNQAEFNTLLLNALADEQVRGQLSDLQAFNQKHAALFELIGEPDRAGRYQLKYLHAVAWAGISVGDVRGWVHPLANLAKAQDARIERGAWIEQGAWIGQDAWIEQGAWIEQDARIGRDARIERGARIGRDARIGRGARIGQDAWIEQDAWIGRDARIGRDGAPRPHNRRDVLVLHPVGSENGTLTAYRNKDGGVSVTRGCFGGTLAEFEAAVAETHGDNKYAQEYAAVIALVKVRFAELLENPEVTK